MLNEFKIDYDSEEDLLYLYNPGKKSGGSVEFGELVIDLEKEGQIVGLEIFGASEYLSELTSRQITKEQLENLQKAVLSFTEKKGTIIVKIILALEKEQVPATIAIQNMRYKSPILARA